MLNKNKHEMTHAGEYPFQCSYCHKLLPSKYKMKRHEMTHTGEKPHQCNYCVKSFRCPSDKKRHEMTHTGEKPYQCSYCVKSFRSTYNKKRHEMTHTGENRTSVVTASSYLHPWLEKNVTKLHTHKRNLIDKPFKVKQRKK